MYRKWNVGDHFRFINVPIFIYRVDNIFWSEENNEFMVDVSIVGENYTGHWFYKNMTEDEDIEEVSSEEMMRYILES